MADDPQATRLEHPDQHDSKCPACDGTGKPFEVEEGRSYRRVTYRCAKCHHTWAQTTALVTETTIRE